MELRHPVHPALRGLVVEITGYDYRLDPRATHHGVPSPAATVIISFDEPLDVGWLSDDSSRSRRWLLASGLHLRPALIRTHGVQHGIQLSLTPAGSRALLGVPVGAMRELLADHADLPRGIPVSLHAHLTAVGWTERFRLLDAHLIHLARRAPSEVPRDIAHAWSLLRASRGGICVEDLASDVGWSRRTLLKRFTGELGLAPSEVARLHRFGAAQHLARHGRPWAEVAAQAGYADQAHLSREFRALAGRTPTAWRTEAFPIVQDT